MRKPEQRYRKIYPREVIRSRIQQQQRKPRLVADFISLFSFTVASTLLFFIFIFLQEGDSPLLPKVTLLLTLLFGGVIFAAINGIRFKSTTIFTKRQFIVTIFIGIPLFTMPLITLLVDGVGDIDIVGAAIFFCSAVAEEWFFRAGLFAWLLSYLGDVYPKLPTAKLTAYLTVSLIFCIYHVFAYSGEFIPLVFAFFGSMLFCALVDLTHNLSSSIVIHSGYNILIVLVTGAGVTV